MNHVWFPDGPEELTPEWFTAIFRANALLTSEAVVGFQREIIGQDRGFTGVIARVHFQYTHHEEGTPSSVVIKFPTASRSMPSAYRTAQSQDMRATQRYFERCSREVFFYQQIAPLGDLPVPQLYYGATDQATGRAILVLEDLRLTRAGDVLHGCTAAEAVLVVDQLAHLHAQWWEHPLLETCSWLPLWGGDAQTEQNRYRQCLAPFLQQFGQPFLALARGRASVPPDSLSRRCVRPSSAQTSRWAIPVPACSLPGLFCGAIDTERVPSPSWRKNLPPRSEPGCEETSEELMEALPSF